MIPFIFDNYHLYTSHWQRNSLVFAKSWSHNDQRLFPGIVNDTFIRNSTLSRNAKTIDFARLTSHPVRGWTGKNKTFCSPGTQNGRRVIKVYKIDSKKDWLSFFKFTLLQSALIFYNFAYLWLLLA